MSRLLSPFSRLVSADVKVQRDNSEIGTELHEAFTTSLPLQINSSTHSSVHPKSTHTRPSLYNLTSPPKHQNAINGISSSNHSQLSDAHTLQLQRAQPKMSSDLRRGRPKSYPANSHAQQTGFQLPQSAPQQWRQWTSGSISESCQHPFHLLYMSGTLNTMNSLLTTKVKLDAV